MLDSTFKTECCDTGTWKVTDGVEGTYKDGCETTQASCTPIGGNCKSYQDQLKEGMTEAEIDAAKVTPCCEGVCKNGTCSTGTGFVNCTQYSTDKDTCIKCAQDFEPFTDKWGHEGQGCLPCTHGKTSTDGLKCKCPLGLEPRWENGTLKKGTCATAPCKAGFEPQPHLGGYKCKIIKHDKKPNQDQTPNGNSGECDKFMSYIGSHVHEIQSKHCKYLQCIPTISTCIQTSGHPALKKLYETCKGIKCEIPKDICDSDVSPVGGDGKVNIEDLLEVLGSYGKTGPRPVKGKESGKVNIEDLLTVLGTFGKTCDKRG